MTPANIPDLDELRRLTDRVVVAQMEREASHRTVLVPTAELAVQVEAITVAAGVSDLIVVMVSQLVPDGQMFIVDGRAISAGMKNGTSPRIRF